MLSFISSYNYQGGFSGGPFWARPTLSSLTEKEVKVKLKRQTMWISSNSHNPGKFCIVNHILPVLTNFQHTFILYFSFKVATVFQMVSKHLHKLVLWHGLAIKPYLDSCKVLEQTEIETNQTKSPNKEEVSLILHHQPTKMFCNKIEP